jgi:hypothetical protein
MVNSDVKALLARGSRGNGLSTPTLRFACAAGEYLTVAQVNGTIDKGLSTEYPSCSLAELFGVDDQLLLSQFGPDVANMKKRTCNCFYWQIPRQGYFKKDSSLRVPRQRPSEQLLHQPRGSPYFWYTAEYRNPQEQEIHCSLLQSRNSKQSKGVDTQDRVLSRCFREGMCLSNWQSAVNL